MPHNRSTRVANTFSIPDFGCLGRKVSFSTATGDYTHNPVSYTHLDVYKRQAKHLRERGDLHRVTQGCAGAVRLDITDALGMHSGCGLR